MELGTHWGKVLRVGGCLGFAGRPRVPGIPGGPRLARINHALGDKFRRKLGSRAGISPAGQPPGQVASIGVSPLSAAVAGVLAVVDACSVFLTGIIAAAAAAQPRGGKGGRRRHWRWPRSRDGPPPMASQSSSPVRVKAIKRLLSPVL